MKKNINWDSKIISSGKKETKKIYSEVLSYTKDILNEYNNLNLELIDYKLILGLFIEKFMGYVYCAWKEILSDYKPKEVKYIPQIRTLLEAYDLGEKNEWNEHIRYMVFTLKSKKLISDFALPKNEITDLKKENIYIDKFLKFLKFKFKEVFFDSNAPVLIHLPRLACGNLEKIINLFKWKKYAYLSSLQYIPLKTPQADWDWRIKKASQSKFEDTFLSLVLTLLPLYLPNEILEGLKENRKRILDLNIKRPKAVFTSAVVDSSIIGILFSEWRKNDTKLVIHQHGGGYDTKTINIAIEDFEKRNSDVFLNWSKAKKISNIKSLSPSSPEFIWKRVHNKKNILFVCNDVTEYPYELEHNLWSEANRNLHIEFSIFIKRIKDKKNLIIRKYPVKSKWNKLDKLLQEYKDLKVDKEKNIFKSYSNSRVTIHMYLSTTLLETMGCNIPSIIFFDPSAYSFNKKTLKIFESLQKVGIFHDTARKASFFLNKTLDDNDIENWWYSSKVQNAREIFCYEFAFFSRNWAEEWDRYFKSLA